MATKQTEEPARRGPKLQGSEKMHTRTFRCTDEQATKLEALGGAQFIRDTLDATPWPRGSKPK